MSESATTPLVVHCAADAKDGLVTALREAGAAPTVSGRENFDGTETGYVLLASVLVRSVPAVLDSLREFLRRDAVDSVTVGDVTVDRPRPADVDRLMELADRHLDAADRETGPE